MHLYHLYKLDPTSPFFQRISTQYPKYNKLYTQHNKVAHFMIILVYTVKLIKISYI